MTKPDSAGYKWDAGDYQASSSNQKRWAVELLARHSFRGDERALDIGCGDGGTTALIAERTPRGSVLGMDSSPDMVELARRNYPPERVPNVTFVLKDARALDFGPEFDLIFSNATLHWIADHRPVLAGISRAMKPGGHALLQMGGRGNAAGVAEVLDGLMADRQWARFFKGFDFRYGFYGPVEYDGWMAAAGLKKIRVELLPKDAVHQGPAGLAAWVRTTWLPYTQRVPELLRPRFVDEIVECYVQRHPADAGGLVHVDMVRLEVEATK